MNARITWQEVLAEEPTRRSMKDWALNDSAPLSLTGEAEVRIDDEDGLSTEALITFPVSGDPRTLDEQLDRALARRGWTRTSDLNAWPQQQGAEAVFTVERGADMDLSAIYREDATDDEVASAYQVLIDSGAAWRMDGSTGRTAMALIEDGYCVLGPEGHRDYYGNYVPSRTEVQPGTKGSVEYANRLTGWEAV